VRGRFFWSPCFAGTCAGRRHSRVKISDSGFFRLAVRALGGVRGALFWPRRMLFQAGGRFSKTRRFAWRGSGLFRVGGQSGLARGFCLSRCLFAREAQPVAQADRRKPFGFRPNHRAAGLAFSLGRVRSHFRRALFVLFRYFLLARRPVFCGSGGCV